MSKEEFVIKNDSIDIGKEWINEKFNHAIRHLAKVMQEDDICQNSDFVSAMTYLLNVFSCLNGKLFRMNSNEILPIVQQYGEDGYDFIIDLFNNTHNGKIAQEIVDVESTNKALATIFDLVRENVKSNRTLINCELDKIKFEDSLIWCLEDDLELLNQGQKTWEWFYEKYKNEHYQKAHQVDDALVELYLTFGERTGQLTVKIGV